MTPEDLQIAQNDFPELYTGINTYDDLRSSKLAQINDELWSSYYFPIYSFLCIPVKLILQVMRLPQVKAFTLTNSLMFIIALVVVKKFLKTSEKKKFCLLALLAASPIMYAYIPYISSETFIFSMMVCTLVAYERNNKFLCAFLLSTASMPNPTVMGMGIVLVVKYMFDTYVRNNEIPFIARVKKYYKDTLLYAVCYIPCLIPFILNLINLKNINPTSGGFRLNTIGYNILSYYFDINLGYSSFAPILVILFFGSFVVSCIRRNAGKIGTYLAFSLSVVIAFSMMVHINCGMRYCARYVIWSYPILAFGLCMNDSAVKNIKVKMGLVGTSVISTLVLLAYNNPANAGPYPVYTECNNFSKLVLNNAPYLYNPMFTTFNSRVCHVDGGSVYDKPIWYTDTRNNEVRKIMLLADEESKEYIRDHLICRDDPEYIDKILSEHRNDSKLYYIDIPPSDKHRVFEKNFEERNDAIVKETYDLAESGITLSGNGELGLVSFDVPLETGTYYKVELELQDDLSDNTIDTFFLDLYGGPEYDFAEQELVLNNDTLHNTNSYTAIVYSGDVYKANAEPLVRVAAVSDQPIHIEKLVISELSLPEEESRKQVLFSGEEAVSGNNELDVQTYSIAIQPDTTYRFELEADGNGVVPEAFFVDLYGGDGYDGIQQEVNLQSGLAEGQERFEFSINSGDTSSADRDIVIRIVTVSDKPISIKDFSVRELDMNNKLFVTNEPITCVWIPDIV